MREQSSNPLLKTPPVATSTDNTPGILNPSPLVQDKVRDPPRRGLVRSVTIPRKLRQARVIYVDGPR